MSFAIVGDLINDYQGIPKCETKYINIATQLHNVIVSHCNTLDKGLFYLYMLLSSNKF